jgi:radical SAM-linked protein
MDFRVTEEITGEEICNRLNEVFPSGLRALEAYVPATKFHDIGWADYELRLEIPNAAEAVEPVKEALSGEIVIDKTTKIGTRTIDIAPLTRILSVSEENGELVLRLRLSATTDNYVNPKYIIDFLTAKLGIPGEKDDYTVCRTAVYLADGETIFR